MQLNENFYGLCSSCWLFITFTIIHFTSLYVWTAKIFTIATCRLVHVHFSELQPILQSHRNILSDCGIVLQLRLVVSNMPLLRKLENFYLHLFGVSFITQAVEVIIGRSIVHTKKYFLSDFYSVLLRNVGVITEYMCNFVELCILWIHCLVSVVNFPSHFNLDVVSQQLNQDGMDKQDH